MSKKILMAVGFLSAVWLTSLQAEELQALTFSIGGGISAPLNPYTSGGDTAAIPTDSFTRQP